MKKKLVTIQSSGPIRELSGIIGPVMSPVWIGVDSVARMVYNGRKVYEVNPANLREKILLTSQNAKAQNFGTHVAPAPVDQQALAEKAPVQKEEPAKDDIIVMVPFDEMGEPRDPSPIEQIELDKMGTQGDFIPVTPVETPVEETVSETVEESTEETPETDTTVNTNQNYRNKKKNKNKSGDFSKN